MEQKIEDSQEGSTYLLSEGSQPEQRSLGNGDLFLAINVETVRQLPNSAGANATTVGGFTELHHAAAQGKKDKVDAILIEGNLKVEVATSDGITALHIAAYGGHETIVTSLLHWYGKNPGADVNARDNVLGRTALHYAVGGGHQRVVEELIKFPGIDICPEDSVQNLTPLLMEVMKPKGVCSLVIVSTLIDARTDQINRAVCTEARLIDDLPWLLSCPIKLFPSDDVLQKFSSARPKEDFGTSNQKNRNKYREIEENRRRTDGSLLESKWKKMGTVDRQRLDAELMILEDMDRYLKYECSMAGHTIFHLAATQDNAEVLSHLLSNCTSANVNILTADGNGMTPLHCAIRAESTETFLVLMSHREVDVNAVLKSTVNLALPPWTELRLHSWWTRKESERFRFYEATCVSDTPLHLAIRCCRSFTLRRMVMKFCNHPRFQPSIYNESGVLPLDLAWLRSSCSLQFGNSSVHLQSVLDMLERQRGNQPLMNEVNSMKTGALNSVNAVLVAAALLGGVTFSAMLQPPTDKRVKLFFWLTDCMCFYFSMYTIMCCLGTSKTMQQHRHLHITRVLTDTTCTSVRVFYVRKQAQLVFPLVGGVHFGMMAFLAAGWANFAAGLDYFVPDTNDRFSEITISENRIWIRAILLNGYVGFSLFFVIYATLSFSSVLKANFAAGLANIDPDTNERFSPLRGIVLTVYFTLYVGFSLLFVIFAVLQL
ncbi:hypothetical protein MPTK1_8g02680 [Marchantia polymorpha subsp. ruderalis]|uniref:PGG domain-containing protein n=1 Tax=Marchantia polymorpha TaxID=3197 RepID=A0A2R6XJ19_MARPO|nr:hypothetical protein MARPO_0012s0060 [Marchantia polymorpha]BBN18460.1 hypothetical protein Mp_8g02680 [Marchantia polymorpha subsp. ruderalis]|eukprot:PTQ46103.1 hypothetical protein MARPO_0012s0060 [Marchantia polymorpha]